MAQGLVEAMFACENPGLDQLRLCVLAGPLQHRIDPVDRVGLCAGAVFDRRDPDLSRHEPVRLLRDGFEHPPRVVRTAELAIVVGEHQARPRPGGGIGDGLQMRFGLLRAICPEVERRQCPLRDQVLGFDLDGTGQIVLRFVHVPDRPLEVRQREHCSGGLRIELDRSLERGLRFVALTLHQVKHAEVAVGEAPLRILGNRTFDFGDCTVEVLQPARE